MLKIIINKLRKISKASQLGMILKIIKRKKIVKKTNNIKIKRVKIRKEIIKKMV